MKAVVLHEYGGPEQLRYEDIPMPEPQADEVLAHMRHDKKAQAGRMSFILARAIGQAFVSRDVPEEAVRAVLAEG